MEKQKNQYCVIIPVYNNVKTIGTVINQCKNFTENIIVLDDGSDDGTTDVIQSSKVFYHRFEKNQGKGVAIKKGIELALTKGYLYAITIDADGQHYPDNIPQFIQKSLDHEHAIIIGTREFKENVMPASKIGLFFSNFFFSFCTLQKCDDTQSGYRLYPVKEIDALQIQSKAYDFEIEVLVKAMWKGIKLFHIPIAVHYDPPELRISHFKAGRDGFKGTKLFSKLCLMAFYKIPIYYWKNRNV